MKKLQVFSDMVCPYCYLAEFPLKSALAKTPTPIQIEWMPFELRPPPQPTLKPEDQYLQTAWKNGVYPTARSMGIDKIKLPTISPQPYTRLPFIGYQYAKEKGKGPDYTHNVFEAFFAKDQDIGKEDVLLDIADQTGLDRNEFKKALDDEKYEQAHVNDLKQAKNLRISAVPTFVLYDGDKMVTKHSGMLSEDDILDMIE
jgi:predicted DsbA family dithiol-disulfide isomerase